MNNYYYCDDDHFDHFSAPRQDKLKEKHVRFVRSYKYDKRSLEKQRSQKLRHDRLTKEIRNATVRTNCFFNFKRAYPYFTYRRSPPEEEVTKITTIYLKNDEPGEFDQKKTGSVVKEIKNNLLNKYFTEWCKSLINNHGKYFVRHCLSYLSRAEFLIVENLWQRDIILKRYYLEFLHSDVTHSIQHRLHLRNKKSSILTPIPNDQLIPLFKSTNQQYDSSIFGYGDMNDEDFNYSLLRSYSNSFISRQKTCVYARSQSCSYYVSSFKEFKSNFFQYFSRNMLKNVTWSSSPLDEKSFKVVVAGGSVVASLQGSPISYNQFMAGEQAISMLPYVVRQQIRSYIRGSISKDSYYFDNKTKHYDMPAWSRSDIDLYLVCNDESIVPERIKILVKEITSNLPVPYKLLRTEHSFTILPLYPYRPIQILTTLLRECSDHILHCDLDCTSLVYDVSQNNVFTMERGINALANRLNLLEPNQLYNNNRAIKYAHRGFSAYCFELCKHYPRCDDKAALEFNPSRRRGTPAFYGYESTDGLPYGPSFKTMESVNLSMALSQNDIPFKEIKRIEFIDNFINEYKMVWKYMMTGTKKCYQCDVNLVESKTDSPIVCKQCIDLNNEKLDQWNGIAYPIDDNYPVALVTGGRSKIGFQTALRLLRSGYTVITTTRFPYNALSNYQKEKDSESWMPRLQIYGIDFRHLPSVNKFIQFVKEKYTRLDILINNAAQTIRRPTAYYKTIYDEENRLKSLLYYEEESTDNMSIISQSVNVDHLSLVNVGKSKSLNSAEMSQIAVTSADTIKYDPSVFPKDMVDEHGEQLDMRTSTTWNQSMEEISMEEMLEVQLINVTVPFMLMSQLASFMDRSRINSSYIINVTSQEGTFNKSHDNGYHIHTNMAKASLNMMTSSTAEQYIKKGIFVCSVDPGWVTKMTSNNNPRAVSAPLSDRDGAARILDPIYTHMKCNQKPNIKHGILYKHYKPSAWA